MEARRRGYRQQGAAPPERGHPLSNLTHLMSQPAPEPALGAPPPPGLRQLPRRYLALGLIIVAIVLLGTLVLVRDNVGPGDLVDGGDVQPRVVVAPLHAGVGAGVGLRHGGRELADDPRHATAARWAGPRRCGRPTVNGGPPLPVVFFYGAEFAPYAAVERWPLILALSRFGTFHQLGLMQSSSTTAFANLSTFTFWNVSYSSRYVILESVERYSSLNPTGARYLSLQTPDARQAAAIASYGTGATDLLPARRRQPVRPERGRLRPRRPGRGHPGPDRRLPDQPGLADDAGRRDRGERDHGGHLLGRREQARRRVREQGRAGGGAGPQGRAARALTGARDDGRAGGAGVRRPGQLARRSSISLRSTSFMPPQIPWGSRIRMA